MDRFCFNAARKCNRLNGDLMLSLQLNYEDGSQHSQQFRLPLDIGRSAASGLRLSSWRVARRHACIQAGPQGVFIEDFGALAGTLVNGQRISYFGPLLEGTEIIIGPCRMVVEKLPLSYADISETSVATPRSDILNATSDSTLSVNQNALTLAYGSDNNKHSLFPETPSSHNNTARTARAELRLSTELESFEYGWNPNQQSYSEIVSSIESQVSEATATVAPSNTPALSESPPVQCVNVHLNHRRRLHRALLEALDLRRRDIVALSDEALRKEAATVLSDLINNDSLIESGVNKQVLCEEVLNEAVGLGPLEPLLADPHINEIMVNRHDEIFVEQEGRLKRHPSVFSSEQAVLSVIERIVSPLGRRIDESSPMVDARLPDGSRVNAVIPPIALRGASVTIRKFPDKRPSMADLLRGGALNEAMAQFLKACVIDRKNIVISGGTGSGKTTLLNILSNFIPNGERVVTIEDAAELKLHHEHLVTLEARPANLEGRGQIAIRDLVRNALRMRPDRIVIGECRDSEAFDMLAAMNTGHEGSLTTLHANSPRDALARLETMILMAGMDLPLAAIREHIASSINLIIQQVRTRTGQRLIKSLVEVTGMESGRIQTQDLFLNQEGPPPVFTSSGLMPEFINKGSNTALSRLSHSLFSEQSAQPSAQLQRSPSENNLTF